MELIEQKPGKVKMAFTDEEVMILNNALNEVVNGIDLKGEFETRMGVTEEEAQKLLDEIHVVMEKARKKE